MKRVTNKNRYRKQVVAKERLLLKIFKNVFCLVDKTFHMKFVSKDSNKYDTSINL